MTCSSDEKLLLLEEEFTEVEEEVGASGDVDVEVEVELELKLELEGELNAGVEVELEVELERDLGDLGDLEEEFRGELEVEVEVEVEVEEAGVAVAVEVEVYASQTCFSKLACTRVWILITSWLRVRHSVSFFLVSGSISLRGLYFELSASASAKIEPLA